MLEVADDSLLARMAALANDETVIRMAALADEGVLHRMAALANDETVIRMARLDNIGVRRVANYYARKYFSWLLGRFKKK